MFGIDFVGCLVIAASVFAIVFVVVGISAKDSVSGFIIAFGAGIAIFWIVFGVWYKEPYVGSAKYVENSVEYKGGKAVYTPVVEVEGRGRFEIHSVNMVGYEIGDTVEVRCTLGGCSLNG